MVSKRKKGPWMREGESVITNFHLCTEVEQKSVDYYSSHNVCWEVREHLILGTWELMVGGVDFWLWPDPTSVHFLNWCSLLEERIWKTTFLTRFSICHFCLLRVVNVGICFSSLHVHFVTDKKLCLFGVTSELASMSCVLLFISCPDGEDWICFSRHKKFTWAQGKGSRNAISSSIRWNKKCLVLVSVSWGKHTQDWTIWRK